MVYTATMKYTIIADSCCNLNSKDLTCAKVDFHVVPLTMILGEEEYVDVEGFDTVDFVAKLNASPVTARSACPTPEAYAEIMRKSDNIIVVALSSKLSGTHASATQAAESIKKSHPEKNIFVLDTLSACTGLDYICTKVKELIMEDKYTFDELTIKATELREKTRVRFLLQDLGNLVKNGRMSKTMGRILTTAKVKVVCGNDGEGGIKKYALSMGTRRGLEKLAEFPGTEISPDMLVIINHVHNEEDANFLKSVLVSKFGFTNISLYGMRGLSSLYAADKGIVIAY